MKTMKIHLGTMVIHVKQWTYLKFGDRVNARCNHMTYFIKGSYDYLDELFNRPSSCDFVRLCGDAACLRVGNSHLYRRLALSKLHSKRLKLERLREEIKSLRVAYHTLDLEPFKTACRNLRELIEKAYSDIMSLIATKTPNRILPLVVPGVFVFDSATMTQTMNDVIAFQNHCKAFKIETACRIQGALNKKGLYRHLGFVVIKEPNHAMIMKIIYHSFYSSDWPAEWDHLWPINRSVLLS